MQYKKIINFVICHDYFDEGTTPTLFTIVPLEQSRVLMDDFGLLFRQNAQGFTVAAKCAALDNSQYFISPPDDSVISVALFANDPYFLNYTELPYIAPGETLFYGSVLTGEKNDVTNTPKSATIKSKGLLVNSLPFTVTPNLANDGINSTQGAADNPVFPNPEMYYLNISDWPDGVYDVSDGSEDNTSFNGTFAFLSRQLMAQSPFVLLTFNIPKTIVSEVTPLVLSFSARSVYWQYQFSALPSGTLTVNTEHATLAFQSESGIEPAPTFKALDKDSQSILSSTAIKLTQAPWLGLELMTEVGTSVIANLPNPQVENIYPYLEDPGGVTQPDLAKGDVYACIPVSLSISSAASSPQANLVAGSKNA